jgi:hypothetical protein
MELEYLFPDVNVIAKRVMITPIIAGNWLLKHNYEKQRPIRTAHIKKLKVFLKTGEFKDSDPITFVKLRDCFYLVNGQHRLTAIKESGIPYELTIMVKYRSTEQELEEIYGAFDVQLKRSDADILYALGTLDKVDITHSQAKQMNSALKWIYTGFKYNLRVKIMSPYIMDNIMICWKDEIKDLFETVHNTDNFKFIRKSPVLASILITMRFEREKSIDFWRNVALDSGLTAGDPRRTLLYFLREIYSKNNHRVVYSPTEIAFSINKCWRAFCENRNLVRITKISDEFVAFKNTPYDTRKDEFGIDARKYLGDNF